MSATTFHLIRHGEYASLRHGIGGRLPGRRLNADGLSQAELLGRHLAGARLAAIVSSPLERARETAAPIAQRQGLPVTIDEDFNEIDFGEWTGENFDALRESHQWHAFNVFRSMTAIPGGETMLAVQARAMAGIMRLRQGYPEGEIAVVSHGDVIKGILAYILGIPLDLFRRLEVSPGSRSVVAVYDDDAKVAAINLMPQA